jgi:hypothetical protein
MVWLPIRRCSVFLFFATITLAFADGVAVRPSVARDGGDNGPVQADLQAPIIPDFAKSVNVRVDGKLVSLDKAVRQMASDPQQKMYRELRAANAGTPAGQLELARWCRKQKMDEEERFHWWTLLGMQPGHPDAIKGLKLHRFQGLLLTTDEIDQLKKQQKDVELAAKKWTPKLKKLKQAIEHGEADERETALRELKSINDPLAIPSVEKVFGFDDVRIGRQLVEMAANFPGDDGAGFLARLAVNSSDQYVRENATEALKDRQYSTYVPVLIAGLAAPIELSYTVDVDPGRPVYEGVNWLENTGRLQVGLYDKIRLSGKYTNVDVMMWVPETVQKSGYMMTDVVLDRVQYNYLLSRDSPDPDKQYEYAGSVVAQEGTAKNQRKLAAKKRKQPSMEEIDRRVKEINEKQALLNERIHAALTASTGVKVVPADQQGTPKPQVWWDWWKKQLEPNGFFARGTEVWTQTGPMAIESILVCDRVLTRKPASGELAFHLVTRTQMKSSGEMRTIELDSRTIVATREQRFMVSGASWQAAGELKDGLKLDGLAGPRLIRSGASGKGAEMYNLVVADEPTLFVDRMGILVHDASRP